MRRTAAVITTLLVTVLTLVGVADPADAAPVPGTDPGCELQTTLNASRDGLTASVDLSFNWHGISFFLPPAWSYAVTSDDTSAVVASNSFPVDNPLQDTIDTTGWKTGSYTATAEFGDPFPSCTTTFAVKGVDDETKDEARRDRPPTAEIDCGSAEVAVGATIKIKGTAHDDKGIAAEKIRFPDGTEKSGNTHVWAPASAGKIAFAYFVVDTGGNQANDLCHVNVVAAPPSHNEAPTPTPTASTPSPTDDSSSDGATSTENASSDDDTPATNDDTTDDTVAEDTDDDLADDDNDSETAESDADDVDGSKDDADPAEPTDDDTEDDSALAPATGGDVPRVDGDAVAPTGDTNADTVGALTEAIQSAYKAETQPPATTTDDNGINVPWWFLIVIVALAAYKPVTDLWRTVTQPGRIRPHHDVTTFDS